MRRRSGGLREFGDMGQETGPGPQWVFGRRQAASTPVTRPSYLGLTGNNAKMRGYRRS